MPLLETLRRILNTPQATPAVASYQSGGGLYSWTGPELWARAEALSAALARRGLEPGHWFGLYMRRSPECVAAMLAGLLRGAPFVPYYPRMGAEGLRELAAGLDGPLLVDWPGLARLAKSPPEAFGERALLVLDARQPSPLHQAVYNKLKSILQVERLEFDAIETPTGEMTERPDPAAPALALYTSGSEGQPKGVEISRDELASRVLGEVEAFALTPSDRLLGLLPFSFDVGLNQAFAALASGASLLLQNSWLPPDLLTSIREGRITGISGVPAIWNSLIEHDPEATGRALAGLRYLTVSGGSLSPARQAELRRLTPKVALIKTYGQTETFRSTILAPEDFERRPDSVGRALPGVRLLVVDDAGRPVAPGEEGELLHQGAGTMTRYRNNPEGTRAKIRPRLGAEQEGPWVHTGDRARLDDDGYLTLLGRRDRMLKLRGNRVYPAEIEAVLEEAPGVAEALAFAVGEGDSPQLVALLRPEPGAELDETALRARLAERLPPYMLPDRLETRDEFPRTPSGKPRLAELEASLHA